MGIVLTWVVGLCVLAILIVEFIAMAWTRP